LEFGDPKEVTVDQEFVAAAMERQASAVDVLSLVDALNGDVPAGVEHFDLLYGGGSRPAKQSGGHNSAPAGYPKDQSKYADPENFMCPLDSVERVHAASGFFLNAVRGRSGVGYSPAELVFLARQISEAAVVYGVKIIPTSLVGKYAGLKASNESEVSTNMSGEQIAREQVETLLARARVEATDAANAAALAPNSEIRKQIIADYEASVLPTKVAEAQAAAREEMKQRVDAFAALEKIKPLTDDERVAVTASMDKGEFRLDLALALRENEVLKAGGTSTEEKKGAQAAAARVEATAKNAGGSGTSEGDGEEEKAKAEATEGGGEKRERIPLLVG